MKVAALFDENGKIIALFHQSSEPNAPKLHFTPTEGQRSELLEVPPELRHLKPAQLHKPVHVDLSSGSPKLVARPEQNSTASTAKLHFGEPKEVGAAVVWLRPAPRLLVHLDALLKERSVTCAPARVADRLEVSLDWLLGRSDVMEIA